jgi:hypothetical protein
MDLDMNGSRYTDTGIGERSTRSLAYLFIDGPNKEGAPRILRPMPHTTSALPHVVQLLEIPISGWDTFVPRWTYFSGPCILPPMPCLCRV